MPAREVVGEAVRVGDRLERLLVALHPEEPDLRRGQEARHALEHAEARAQDRHDEGARLREPDADRPGHGRLDLVRLDAHVPRRLVREEGDQLVDEEPERRGRRLLVPQDGQLVGHERVVGDVQAHGDNGIGPRAVRRTGR
ncbi:Uncharacterised protein [Mycobacteroides abscessus]|nr:Uncharacterised protein [Mycobacteroides abscessus]